MLEIFVEAAKTQLNDKGVAMIPNGAEVIFTLKQTYADLEYVRGDGSTGLYLKNTVDVDYYLELINALPIRRKVTKYSLIPLMGEFITLSRENGTTVEAEVREFFS